MSRRHHRQASNTHSIFIGYVAWILGFMGMHRFYYGKPLTGILWFFTGGIFLIGWIIDLFLIPSMDQEADFRFEEGRIDYSLTWILLIFTGWLGLHRMYMGKWLTGVLYLFTFGLFGFGWLYDLCTLNSQINEENQFSNYNEARYY